MNRINCVGIRAASLRVAYRRYRRSSQKNGFNEQVAFAHSVYLLLEAFLDSALRRAVLDGFSIVILIFILH